MAEPAQGEKHAGVKALLAAGLGTGYLPIAPGTWGSLPAALIWLALAPAGSQVLSSAVMALLAVVCSIVCVLLGPFAERHFGKKDPGQVVIDEWAGQALALFALPIPGSWGDRVVVAGVAFVAFRVFDIIKPPPARGLQKLPAGWGIGIDDLIAGVYANIATQLILRLMVGGVG